MKPKIFIIDGSSFLYRAFYALKPMHTPQGVPVGAVYGFCRIIKKLVDTFDPTHFVIAWDSPGATERHALFTAYKATRQAMPLELRSQKDLIKQFAHEIGIYQAEQPGIEADDIMHSLAQDFSKAGFDAVLVTTDKDLGQIITETITIYDAFKEEVLDAAKFEARYGFAPTKLPFYFALVGDSSDNIPGVAGIGEKTATDLVKQFASLADMYTHIDQIAKERTRTLLLANRDNGFLSEQLFLLRYHALNISPAMVAFEKTGWQKARGLFKELNFKSFLKDMPDVALEEELLSKKHGFQFVCIATRKQLAQLCQAITKAGYCAIDTETNSLMAYQSRLVGISLCTQVGTAYYIPTGHKESTGITRADIFELLKPVLEDQAINKYLHHAKFDQLVLSRYGIELQGIIFDTHIAASLLTSESQRTGLKLLSSIYLDQTMLTFEEIMKQGKFKDFSDVPLDLATEYAASDAHQTFQLVPILRQKLIEFEQTTLFATIELPLVQTLYLMEKEGIIIDTQILKAIDMQVINALELIRNQIVQILGEEYKQVNLSSPKQIEEILFVKLQLTPTKKTAKKTGYSTDQEVLLDLAQYHEIPALIVKYRELYKLKSTYLDTLPTYINPFTDRIHTSFKQAATATGRLASSDPNLQNIPVGSIIGDISIRSAFRAPEGTVFLSADYSQIELRVLAYLSQDEKLVAAFLNNEDIHARTASGLFEVPLPEVTHEQRQIGKRINFSILYGLTPYGLSKDLKISYSEAETYIDRYFAQYPQVSSWMDCVIEETKKLGYVTTLWGRRRYVPGIYEKNRSLYELAQRIAINTKAQGTAAEIMKIGMNSLQKLFNERNLNEKMILQIHDELLITTSQENVAQTEALVLQTLQNVVSWNIPLIVTTRSGTDWGEVTK